MTHEHWSIEDGLQLQAMMTSLQLDDWQIAQANALSVHQVRELLLGVPVGKASSFYSERIKRHAGQQLLERLGVGSNTS